jgi:peptidoglycan/LPS O-acetylase OafA/YrhL
MRRDGEGGTLVVESTAERRQEVAEPTRFRYDIEGLRAVAVLAVLAYHLELPGFSGGFAGVDVFFVISGYLITGHLVSEVARNGRVRFGDFYARRVRRILPAATVVIVGTVVLAAVFQNRLDYALMTGADARSSALFYSNIRFFNESTDYLAEAGGLSLFQQFWSLSVEEQFYLLWPVLVAAIAWLTARSQRRTSGDFVGPLRTVLGIVVAASFVLCLLASSSDPIGAFFLLPYRGWELGLGALLALSADRVGQLTERFARPLAAAGLAAIAFAVVAFDGSTTWPGVAATVPVLGAVAIITGGLGGTSSITARFLAIRPMQVVGRHSYSIYLWHWPIVVLLADRDLRYGTFVLVACVLTVVSSAASYRFVEQPVRRSLWLSARTTASLYLGVVLVAIGLMASLIPSVMEGDFDTGEPSGAAAHATGAAIVPTDFVPSDLEPPLLQGTSASDPNATRNADCTELGRCSYGDLDSDVTVVLFGDSHAGHWSPAMAAVAEAEGWRLEQISQGGCGTYKTDADCVEWLERRWADIEAMQPDVIILSNFYGRDLRNAEAMRDVVSRAPAGTDVILFSATPWRRDPPPQCLAENLRDTSSCEPRWPDAAMVAINDRLAEIADTSRAGFVDLTPLLCTADRCPAIAGNVLVYRDGSHLTTRFTETRAGDVGRALTGLVSQS